MAKEKNLTAVTSVAAADFARVVTSAGASVKATFANVAKYIIETYNGSTVAGSAQSVKSALDSLNSNIVAERVSKSSGLPEIPANTSIRVEIDASKSGYTPIGIIEVTGSGNNGLLVQDFYFQGATANLYFRNVTSSAKTAASVTIRVLYMKN